MRESKTQTTQTKKDLTAAKGQETQLLNQLKLQQRLKDLEFLQNTPVLHFVVAEVQAEIRKLSEESDWVVIFGPDDI